MKLMKRTGIYKARNVTFNPKTLEAHSYGWWKFVGLVDGQLVFNNYRYSNTTARHQNKVRSLLNDLNIKIDLELPLPDGINGESLESLILIAEEHLCDQISRDELKKQERNERAKAKRFEKKLENYLENVLHFRDYEIKPKSLFGVYNTVAVHQCVDDVEYDANRAVESFLRDGFSSVVFYI